jgi:replicative DNA helicase
MSASQLIRAGKLATPITLKTFLGEHDLGGVTVPQYLARLAATGLKIGLSMANGTMPASASK